MKPASFSAIVAVLICVALTGAAQEKKRHTKYDEFAKVCGVDVGGAANGVYAKGHGGWQQFANVKAVPKEHGREMAQYWRGEHGGSLVQLAMRDGTFTRYHEYCFDPDGRLTRLTYETRARSEGWGYATTGTVNEAGRLVPASSRFFTLRSGRTIPRPPESADAGWVLHPKIYKRMDKLPFAKLMATPLEQKKEDAQAH